MANSLFEGAELPRVHTNAVSVISNCNTHNLILAISVAIVDAALTTCHDLQWTQSSEPSVFMDMPKLLKGVMT